MSMISKGDHKHPGDLQKSLPACKFRQIAELYVRVLKLASGLVASGLDYLIQVQKLIHASRLRGHRSDELAADFFRDEEISETQPRTGFPDNIMERTPPVVDRNIAVESEQQPIGTNPPIVRPHVDPRCRDGVRLPREMDDAPRYRRFTVDFRGSPRFKDREDRRAYRLFRDRESVSSRLDAAKSSLLTEQENIPDTDDHTLPVSRWTRPLRLSRIEDLPYELLLEVLDHLELYDEYYISCTSWTMYQTLQALRKMDNWGARVSRLSRQERLKFLTGIAYVMPDKWTCKDCCKLHRVDESDFPLVEDDPAYRPLSNSRDKYPCPFGPPSSVVIASHEFHYAHIQMALKLNRLGMTDHPYYEKLMRVNECPALRVYRPDRRVGSHSMIPKIVDGRFLFQTKVIWNFPPKTNQIEDVERDWARPNLCECRRWGPPATYNYFQRGDGNQLEPGDVERMLYCTNCRTECSIVVKETEFTVTIWYDLGAYGSPDEFTWSRDQDAWSMRPRDDGAMSGAPGSVRDLWEQDED